MSASPSPLVSGSLVSFTVLLNGSVAPSAWQVVSIETRATLNGPAQASIVINDGSPADATNFFPIANSTLVTPGTRLDISAGYNGQEAPIFSGHISQIGIQIQPEGASHLIISSLAPATTVPPPQPGAKPVLFLAYADSILSVALQFSPHSKNPGDHASSGDVSFNGSSLAVPGAHVELSHLGPRFDGAALINAVRHSIKNGQWITTISVGTPSTSVV